MPTPLDHPAVAVAADVAAASGTPMWAAAVHVRDEFAAVVLAGDVAGFGPVRCTVPVHRVEGRWITPGGVRLGSGFGDTTRPERTGDHSPLRNLSRDTFGGGGDPESNRWFALTGSAARDVVSVTVRSSLERTVATPADDGLVFAVVAVGPRNERPSAEVRTRDGRTVAVAP